MLEKQNQKELNKKDKKLKHMQHQQRHIKIYLLAFVAIQKNLLQIYMKRQKVCNMKRKQKNIIY